LALPGRDAPKKKKGVLLRNVEGAGKMIDMLDVTEPISEKGERGKKNVMLGRGRITPKGPPGGEQAPLTKRG